MRYVLLAASSIAALLGCVVAPAPERENQWNACVSAGQFAGDRIEHDDGRVGTIKRVYGASGRCRDGRHPKLAEVAWE